MNTPRRNRLDIHEQAAQASIEAANAARDYYRNRTASHQGVNGLLAGLLVGTIGFALLAWMGYVTPPTAIVSQVLNLGTAQASSGVYDVVAVQPCERLYGTVDIGSVGANDQGISRVNTIGNAYVLFQNSTCAAVVEHGNVILVNQTGGRIFR